MAEKFSVELIYRSSVPDNITNWRVFEDYEQIINFLHSEDTFKGSVIDNERNEALLQASTSEEKPKHNNKMPKNIVRVEKLGPRKVKFYFSQDTTNRELVLITGQLPVLPKHYWKGKDFSKFKSELSDELNFLVIIK